MQPLSLGISPCPNDTFIFHALISGLVPSPRPLRVLMRDVEQLNRLAGGGGDDAPDICKLSLGAVPFVLDEYALLRSGAAVGFGTGPLLVAREALSVGECRDLPVAVPGRFTTAGLLLNLHGGFGGPREEMIFSRIIPAVAAGECPCGVIIHEGRFTYAAKGLHKVLDFGEWWEEAFRAPLPLGVIAARRSLGAPLIAALEEALRASLRHALARPSDGRNFIRAHAQEMDEEIIDRHIRAFVTDFSLDLGADGEKAVRALAGEAARVAGKTRLPDPFAL
jgi:1,4-dihydroxy-6-naphthoate synthase